MRQVAEFFDHDSYFTPETRGIARAGYFGLCAFLDAQVGRALAALDSSGQAGDTLVLLTSDHGEMLGQRAIWGKSAMYEASAKVPLIISGPGIGEARRDHPVSLIDLAPTLCQAAGLETPFAGFSGSSLLDPPAPDRTVISEYHDGGSPVGITMVRWGQWKYVHYAESHPPELFDLAADPEEKHDLAYARSEIVAEARRRMAEFLDPEEVNARAHADQARLVGQLGGREKLLAVPQWNFTPADSR